jgi:hypothetical protein
VTTPWVCTTRKSFSWRDRNFFIHGEPGLEVHAQREDHHSGHTQMVHRQLLDERRPTIARPTAAERATTDSAPRRTGTRSECAARRPSRRSGLLHAQRCSNPQSLSTQQQRGRQQVRPHGEPGLDVCMRRAKTITAITRRQCECST